MSDFRESDFSNKPALEGAIPKMVRLLSDRPSNDDQFAAKAHRTIASSIAELVNREPGSRVIGLEGSWGSGKSTVVGLATHDFQFHGDTELDDRLVVTFDAWAHQGDRLRRTFLDYVILQMEQKNWIGKANAEALRGRLSGRATNTQATSKSRFSIEGRIASVAALALIMGSALIQHHFPKPWIWLQIALSLMLTPFVVFTLFGLIHLTGYIATRWNFKWRRLRSWKRVRAFSFFEQAQETNTVTNSIEQGEPTSVEFSELFTELMEATMIGDRRLLIVLDNLDRVDESAAQSILATMQIFLSSAQASTKWGDQVWTMVTYAPSGFIRSSGPRLTELTQELSPVETASLDLLFDKIFQIRFRVPPMVLSDWRDLLLRLLQEAFPDNETEELQAIVRLRSAYRAANSSGSVASERPTPRQLIHFVNQIGSIYRQRQLIPILHVSYFVLLQRDANDIVTDLQNGTLPYPTLAHLVQATIESDLAALYYGTTREMGEQYLLSSQLEIALEAGDLDVVEELKERSGFIHCLDAIDLAERCRDGGVGLARMLATLQQAQAFDDPAVMNWFVTYVSRLVGAINLWSLSGSASGRGIAFAFSLTTHDEVGLQESLRRIDSSAVESDTDGRLHMSGISSLINSLDEESRFSDELRLSVNIPADRFVNNFALLVDETVKASQLCCIELTDPNASMESLIESAIAGSSQALIVAESICERPERINSEKAVQSISSKIRDSDPTAEQPFEVLLQLFDLVRPHADAVARAVVDDGALSSTSFVSAQLSQWDAAATGTMNHLLTYPALEITQTLKQSVQGIELMRSVLTNPSSQPELMEAQTRWLLSHPYVSNSLLFEIDKTPGFHPWVLAQMKKLRELGEFALTANQYIQNLKQLRVDFTQDEVVQFTQDLLDDPESVDALASSQDPNVMRLAIAACGKAPERHDPQRFWQASADILAAKSNEEWREAILTPNLKVITALAIEVQRFRHPLATLHNLNSALRDHAKAVAASDDVWISDGNDLRDLALTTGPDACRVLASQIAAELETFDGEIGPEFFPMYGPFLLDQDSFRTHPKLPNVVTSIVTHERCDDISWFATASLSRPDLFATDNRGSEMDHLTQVVKNQLVTASENCKEELTALAAALSIELPDTLDPDEGDEAEEGPSVEE